MKSNLIYEKVKINKIVYDKNIEHQISYQFQLPDYYTGIFKVLHFSLSPQISSCRVSNKQFIVDGNAEMKLLYVDEEGGNIRAIHQNIPFSKTVDVEEVNPESIIFYKVKTTYKNCKIISPKKLDVKADLIISTKIQTQVEEEILKNTKNKKLQLKHAPLTITSSQIWNYQQFNVKEQIELNTTAKEILDVKISISDEECKIISNKIISKAVAHIEVLYCGELKNTPLIDKTSVPINNIVDMPNINEKYLFNCNYSVISTNFEILQDGKKLRIDSDIVINCYANLCKNITVVVDAFSTTNELNLVKKEFNASTITSSINENVLIEKDITDVNIEKILYVYAEIVDLINSNNEKKLKFKAKLNLNILGLNKEEALESLNKTLPVEFYLNENNLKSNFLNININDISILNIETSFSENKNLNIRVKFKIKGFIFKNENSINITDVVINKDKVKEKSNAALTLYYPTVGDKIWNIAKNFCTSPEAIMEANNLENDEIKDETMLIIPII